MPEERMEGTPRHLSKLTWACLTNARLLRIELEALTLMSAARPPMLLWATHLLLNVVPMAMHGEVHEPNGAVIDKGISVLAVQVRLTAHCEDHACM